MNKVVLGLLVISFITIVALSLVYFSLTFHGWRGYFVFLALVLQLVVFSGALKYAIRKKDITE